MTTHLGAIVLAAGASTRMGRPKANLTWKGRSFLECAVGLATEAGCEPTIVVQGARSLPAVAGSTAVDNPDWARGQLSSLRVGIRALLAADPGAAGALVLTVDRPRVRAETAQSLIAAWREEPECIWQPRHAGRTGHPIVYPAALLPLLVALPAEASARDLVRSEPIRPLRRALETDDPGVIENIDTVEDLARLGA